MYDLETRTWLVPSKNPQDEYILDKDGRVFNKTKGVYSDTGTTTPAVTNTDTTKIDQSIATIDEILKPDKFLATNLPGVGSNIIARFDPVEGVTGKTQEFIGKVEQLVKDLALQNLIKSKGEGATFGALSEGELKLLMETASPISKWAIKDDKGNVIGYDIDQASFRRELERIKENLTAQKNKASQGTKDITANKSLSDMAIELGYSKEELKEALQTDSYDTVMNMIKDKYKSKNISGGGGTPTASSIGSAITAQESGGNYRAVNKDSGALGAHQIMPFHLPKIGLTTSTADQQKFLNSPELQDKLQAMIIDENIKNYGSKEKAIAAYYGGGLAAKNYGTKQGDIQGKYDALGRPTGYPSVNEYVSQVLSRLNA
ncbi:MAG: Transglycosylase SLT domain protein [Parcubacteria group bacterium ADurb.Bin216]|nr:MAG: Transglycosylase SLT domain protein [Parcubacteria group bacterium ADurb.Bin216]